MNLKEYVKAIWELSGFCMILCLCQLNLIDTFSEHLWHLWHLCLWFRTGQDDTLQSAWHWPQGHHLDGNDTFIGTNQTWPTFYDSCNIRNSFANLHNAFLHLRIFPVLPGSFFFRSPSLQLNAKMRAEGICSAWRWFDCAANFVNFTNFANFLDRSGQHSSTVPSKLLKPWPTALGPLHPGK